MAGTLALIPRFLTPAEKKAGISELKGEEFRFLVDAIETALVSVENGHPLKSAFRREIAEKLVYIAAGDSRRVSSVQPGDYSAVFIDGLPLWLVCAIQEALEWLSCEMKIAEVIGGKLVKIWPIAPMR